MLRLSTIELGHSANSGDRKNLCCRPSQCKIGGQVLLSPVHTVAENGAVAENGEKTATVALFCERQCGQGFMWFGVPYRYIGSSDTRSGGGLNLISLQHSVIAR